MNPSLQNLQDSPPPLQLGVSKTPLHLLAHAHLKGYCCLSVGKQTHDLTVTANDSKTTQSGGDNLKKFPLGAALQVPQNFPFALL